MFLFIGSRRKERHPIHNFNETLAALSVLVARRWYANAELVGALEERHARFGVKTYVVNGYANRHGETNDECRNQNEKRMTNVEIRMRKE